MDREIRELRTARKVRGTRHRSAGAVRSRARGFRMARGAEEPHTVRGAKEPHTVRGTRRRSVGAVRIVRGIRHRFAGTVRRVRELRTVRGTRHRSVGAVCSRARGAREPRTVRGTRHRSAGTVRRVRELRMARGFRMAREVREARMVRGIRRRSAEAVRSRGREVREFRRGGTPRTDAAARCREADRPMVRMAALQIRTDLRERWCRDGTAACLPGWRRAQNCSDAAWQNSPEKCSALRFFLLWRCSAPFPR